MFFACSPVETSFKKISGLAPSPKITWQWKSPCSIGDTVYLQIISFSIVMLAFGCVIREILESYQLKKKRMSLH